MSNRTKPVISVYWSQLRGPENEAWQRDCPFCENGLFLIGRERGMLELQEIDSCISCGQRIAYLDIEEMRKRDWATAPDSQTA